MPSGIPPKDGKLLVVLDTGIILAGLNAVVGDYKRNACGDIIRGLKLEYFRVVATDALLRQYNEVLLSQIGKNGKIYSKTEVDVFIDYIRRIAWRSGRIFVDPPLEINPRDAILIHTELNLNADFIITNDVDDVLSLKGLHPKIHPILPGPFLRKKLKKIL